MNTYIVIHKDEIQHYGVKGMKWGVRKQVPIIGNIYNRQNSIKGKEDRKRKLKKAAKIGGAIAIALLASYGVYKLSKNPQIIKSGKDLLNNKQLNSPKHIPSQRSNNSSSTFKPETFKPVEFKPETFKPVEFKPETFKPETFNVKPTSKKVSDIPKKAVNISQKTTSTPVKDVSKDLKRYYGNLDPVKDDYYDYMNSVMKGLNIR